MLAVLYMMLFMHFVGFGELAVLQLHSSQSNTDPTRHRVIFSIVLVGVANKATCVELKSENDEQDGLLNVFRLDVIFVRVDQTKASTQTFIFTQFSCGEGGGSLSLSLYLSLCNSIFLFIHITQINLRTCHGVHYTTTTATDNMEISRRFFTFPYKVSTSAFISFSIVSLIQIRAHNTVKLFRT